MSSLKVGEQAQKSTFLSGFVLWRASRKITRSGHWHKGCGKLLQKGISI
jgi:hypothetical protein